MQLVLQVESRYQMAPITLFYIDEANEQITIDSDMVLKKAMRTAYMLALDKSQVVLRLIVSLPANIEKTDLDLETFKGSQTAISTEYLGATESWTNLSQKESLLFNLHKTTGFSMQELEKIYSAFIRVTQKRHIHQQAGYVSLPEFTEIMRFLSLN